VADGGCNQPCGRWSVRAPLGARNVHIKIEQNALVT
jgi:hypothetical protein